MTYVTTKTEGTRVENVPTRVIGKFVQLHHGFFDYFYINKQ